MRRTIAIVLGVVAVTAVFGIVLTRRLISTAHPAGAPTASSAVSATSGRGMTLQFSDKPVVMPAVSLTDASGKPLDRSSWAGKVVLVNFWATWCGPCREEIPALVELQRRYADRLVVIGLSIDTRPPAEVEQFAQQFHINYPVAVVGEGVQQAFGGIPAVPSTFVVSPEGKMMQRHVGSLEPARTEQEVRVLAGLSSEAVVQVVADTGQVFLSNAAYATEIPGVDLKPLSASQREAALTRMNTERCSCGCGLTIAQCRINDPSCDVSLPQAKKIAADAAR
jgi:thiol-disulfide isomerase/thioredoxin